MNDYTFFKSGIEYLKVIHDDIMYLQSDHVYVHMQTVNCKIILRASLPDVQNKLPDNFIRVHQRYLVNKNHISKINSESVFVGGEEFPLTQKYKKDLMGQLDVFYGAQMGKVYELQG